MLYYLTWKWKYSEMFKPRIRDHNSLESWGIQGAQLTWGILKYSARIQPNILCWVSFVDFPKRTLRPVIDGNNLRVMMKQTVERLKTAINITWCGWFSRVTSRCVAANFHHFSTLEIFELKGWQNDECFNMYILNRNRMESVLSTVFSHSFLY